MIRGLIFVLLLIPFIYLVLELFIFQTAIDPIKYIYTITGATAITLLFFTTTLSLWFKKLIRYRRMIGLFGFFYAFLHLCNFFILDMDGNLLFAFKETLDKPFIYLGMISFLLLLFMAATSTKRLFRKYGKYHKVLYIVLVLTTIHFVMAQKSLSVSQYGYLTVIFVIALFKIKKILQVKKTQ
ncbi:sulfite oxidase heme-binding subunit YedZ [Sulfurovum sp. TSL1]|uniref:sulfite oxidase heme-binding subunit YedZ n=1 Tax=Sulfurovum sp. TSL1 TaxID=2826994 RepID=UPI001CC369D0|nr:ferric reductase-like transmembrane domain-containing protein [Sulfurovum sp. TSL1]GIT98892.1 hypothetical protein TSL1_17130 [Sulfurovum sp. TSL1]